MDSPKAAVRLPWTTVRGALAWAIPELTEAEVLSPRLDSEVLLAHVLGWKRARLYAFPECVLREEQCSAFATLIERRRQHEPVPYIVGHREFYGLDFAVDQRVLIPRPETELLVEHVLDSAAHLGVPEAGLTLVDVGTGSGIVAISLSVHLPHAKLYATDVSAEALDVARANAARHDVLTRVHFLRGELLDPVPEAVHMVIANLPYIPTGFLSTLSCDVIDYEPRLALHGGEDGLRLVQALLSQAGSWLLPHGVIWLEIGAYQGQRTLALARQFFPQAQVDLFSDYAHLDRNVCIRI